MLIIVFFFIIPNAPEFQILFLKFTYCVRSLQFCKANGVTVFHQMLLPLFQRKIEVTVFFICLLILKMELLRLNCMQKDTKFAKFWC